MAESEMKPCVLCGTPTDRRYTYDMDLPSLPACNVGCFHAAIMQALEKERAARKSLPISGEAIE